MIAVPSAPHAPGVTVPDSHNNDTVRSTLANLELLIILDSPNSDYRLEYFTTSYINRKTLGTDLTRTYRLIDLVKGGVIPEPWDAFDLDKQTTLVTNLQNFCHYRIAKIVSGWQIACTACGHVKRGKIWEAVPKRCAGTRAVKCRAELDEKQVVEVLLDSCKT